MLDLIASLFVRLFSVILYFVPIEATLWFARRVGVIAYMVNVKRRMIAYANLKAAFSKEKSPSEIKAIVKGVYRNFVQTFFEIVSLTKLNEAYVKKYVKCENEERAHFAARSGKGTVLLTAHYDNWELASLTSAVRGYPILILVREQKMKRLNELLNVLRESKGGEVVRKGVQTRNFLKALRDGKMAGIVADQDAGRNGMLINFFGRPTSTHYGGILMARRTGSYVLPNFIVRNKGPYHTVYLEEFIDVSGDNEEEALRRSLQCYNDLLEKYVRAHPDQWLWLHKRWKSTPTRTVLVLDDGKAGHLNQSLAVAGQIRKARTTQGYGLHDTKIEIVRVEYKSRMARAFLSVCAAISGYRCQGCMKCMKYALTGECCDTLMKSYSEFVVSCGSSTAAVNALMALENNAKNVVVMKPPPLLGLGKFKAVIMPKHDNPPKRKNVAPVRLAPSLIDAESMKANGEKVSEISGVKEPVAIGLLLGGDNPEFRMDAGSVTKVLDGLLKYARQVGAPVLVSTSRRTGKDVEDMLKSRLKDEPSCKLLVVANERNVPEAVGGILALSRAAVVSGESISMVSEAVASGRRVVVFNLEKKTSGKTKHEAVMDGMARDGLICLTDAEGVYDTLSSSAVDGSASSNSAVADEDRKVVFDAVRRLI